MDQNKFSEITKKYSTSFYWTSFFFPKQTKMDVYALYSFLRYSDELADTIKDKKLFYKFRNEVLNNLDKKTKTHDKYINAFLNLYKKYTFKQAWVVDFFKALDQDLQGKTKIKSFQDLEKYAYGVAGVVGLMMSKIIHAPEKASEYAMKLGTGMQIVNILRDVKEDYQMKRVYLPEDDIKKFSLEHIYPLHEKFNKHKFENLIRYEISKVNQIFSTAEKGLSLIPKQYKKPIFISMRLYQALSKKIQNNPMSVWDKKVKLSKPIFFWIIAKNLIYES